MAHTVRKVSSISEAYLSALRDVWYNYEYRSAPRDQPIREIVDYSFKVTNPTVEPIRTFDGGRNETIASYTAKEMELYDSGTNRVEDFGEASKFWLKLANPDGTVNSAYGHLIWKYTSHGDPAFEGGEYDIETVRENPDVLDNLFRTPWEWAKESLRRDKDTRQAVLRFNLPEHAWFGTKDFPCTMHGNFLIRDDKLHLSIIMRSNDMVKGLAYDCPWFVSLMYKMRDELSDVYPELEIGEYTHLAHSLHIYERDKDTVLSMLGE